MYSIARSSCSQDINIYIKKITWNVPLPMAYGPIDISSHINQGMQVKVKSWIQYGV